MTQRIPPYNGIYHLPARALSTGPVPCPYVVGPATALPTAKILPFRKSMLTKIISGGQTGVDRGALDAALEASFPCGGSCPKGRRAEDGEIPLFYPLNELPARGYQSRTKQNVIDSNGTLIICFGELTGGSLETLRLCQKLARPALTIDASHKAIEQAAVEAVAFIEHHSIAVLNVAGSRESSHSGAALYAKQLVQGIIGRVLRLRHSA